MMPLSPIAEATARSIQEYLRSGNALTSLCTRNGRVDGATLHFHVLSRYQEWVIVAVEFMRVVNADAVGEPDERPCFCRLELRLDTRTDCVVEAHRL
jgi:hypothetical protein